MNWGGYEIYNPGVFGPLPSLSRADARRAYDRRMETKPERIGILRPLVAANGIRLAATDVGIQELNDWFRANIESDPDHPGRLLPEWYSVVNDVAPFLGDVMLQRCPGLGQW